MPDKALGACECECSAHFPEVNGKQPEEIGEHYYACAPATQVVKTLYGTWAACAHCAEQHLRPYTATKE